MYILDLLMRSEMLDLIELICLWVWGLHYYTDETGNANRQLDLIELLIINNIKLPNLRYEI